MKAALLAVLGLLGGCFEDRYRCASDADCDLGPGARCELDGFCTAHDPTCVTERRYSEHSGEVAEQCFDDALALANPCAGGQPPALREGCAAEVCDALPACCDLGWSDACVQEAQLRCEIRCDTRIALTATRGASTTEHWDFTWDGTEWRGVQHTDREGLLAWVGPAPGQVEPRLVGFTIGQTSMVVGDRELPASPARDYQSITSVDFDRNGRDTLAIAYVEGTQLVELVDVETGTTRDIPTDVAGRMSWGDSDRDGFPDGIAAKGGLYTLLRGIDTELHVRSIEATQSSNMGGGLTPGSPAVRDLAWLDVNGDHRLDLVAFGSQIRVHADEGALRDTPLVALDCDPPGPPAQCPKPQQTENTSFAGAAFPSLTESAVIAATFTDRPGISRRIYKVVIAAATATPTPLVDSCPNCDPLVAVIARDLDGDGQLDMIGIDGRLRFHTALTTRGFVVMPEPSTPPRPTAFVNVFTSVTGAPIP